MVARHLDNTNSIFHFVQLCLIILPFIMVPWTSESCKDFDHSQDLKRHIDRSPICVVCSLKFNPHRDWQFLQVEGETCILSTSTSIFIFNGLKGMS